MKEVLSLFTFGIGALFFVVFFAAFKPDVVTAVPGPSKPELLQHESFAYARLPLCTSLPQCWGLTSGSDSEHRAAAYAANDRFAPRAVIPASGLFTQVTDWLLAGPESIGCATRKR